MGALMTAGLGYTFYATMLHYSLIFSEQQFLSRGRTKSAISADAQGSNPVHKVAMATYDGAWPFTMTYPYETAYQTATTGDIPGATIPPPANIGLVGQA